MNKHYFNEKDITNEMINFNKYIEDNKNIFKIIKWLKSIGMKNLAKSLLYVNNKLNNK